MNKKERKKLSIIRRKVEDIRDELDSIKGVEEDKRDNAPNESLGERFQDDIACLEEAVSHLDDAMGAITDVEENRCG